MKFRISLLAVLLVTGPVLAQDKVDKVRVITDRTKTPPTIVTRTGTVQAENAAKVTFLGQNGQKTDIKNSDIVEIQYDGEPDEAASGRVAENKKAYDQALPSYVEALKKVPKDNKLAATNLEFKVAKMLTQQADAGAVDARAKAIDALRKFKDAHPDARQTVEALDMLSRLLVMDGKPADEVVKAFQTLRAKHAENKEISNRCDLFESQLLLQEGQLLLKDRADEAKNKYTQAQTKLTAMLQGAEKADALRVRIGLAECKAALGKQEEAIKDIETVYKEAGDDNNLKAAVHLGRADCFRLNKQFREAMWDYLWVDVVYNQDREQQARALFYLQECFDGLKDSDPTATSKAKDARDRLQNDPRLKDTRYQKLAGK
jgi:tetratricopeptide (TPR) repeat protein